MSGVRYVLVIDTDKAPTHVITLNCHFFKNIIGVNVFSVGVMFGVHSCVRAS